MCREQNFNPDVCANLSSHTKAQASVQEEVSTINMYLELLNNIPAVFFVLFLGSWSDKHGRKIPMLLPSCGSFLATLVYLVRSHSTVYCYMPTIYNIFFFNSFKEFNPMFHECILLPAHFAGLFSQHPEGVLLLELCTG